MDVGLVDTGPDKEDGREVAALLGALLSSPLFPRDFGGGVRRGGEICGVIETSGCTFVKAGPTTAESLLLSLERVAAGVRGGECIADTAGDLRGEEYPVECVFSREPSRGLGSFDGTYISPKMSANV